MHCVCEVCGSHYPPPPILPNRFFYCERCDRQVTVVSEEEYDRRQREKEVQQRGEEERRRQLEEEERRKQQVEEERRQLVEEERRNKERLALELRQEVLARLKDDGCQTDDPVARDVLFGDVKAAESVLHLHRMMQCVVQQRGDAGFLREEAAIKATIPQSFHDLIKLLRQLNPSVSPTYEFGHLQQKVQQAKEELMRKQLAIKSASANLTSNAQDEAIDAALRGIILDRDRSRNALWRMVQQCYSELGENAGVGKGPDFEMDVERLQGAIRNDITAIEKLLLACEAHRGPSGQRKLGRSATGEISSANVIHAYDSWLAQSSHDTAQKATDAALQAVTEVLSHTRLLVPHQADASAECKRMAKLMQQAEETMRAELQAFYKCDPATTFPSDVIIQRTHMLLDERQKYIQYLEDLKRQLTIWKQESESLKLTMALMDNNKALVQQLRKCEQQLADAQDEVTLKDLQHSQAIRKNLPMNDVMVQVEAARAEFRKAKAEMQRASAALVAAVADFPELAPYIEVGLPQSILPLWTKGRKLDDFENRQVLTVMSRNQVWRGALGGKEYAIKSFDVTNSCLQEASRLVRAAHPHIVEVVAVFQDPVHQKFYIQMPYYAEGPLDQWAVKHQPDVSSMRRALLQAFEGVAHLHRLGIVHSDLKPSNILVAANGVVRVGDLDVSVDLATRVSAHYATTTVAAVGYTANYAAPELLQTGATPAADVYSLGAVVKELGTQVTSCAGPDADAFIDKLCAKEPAQRPTVASALEDDFFRPALAWRQSEQRECCVMGSDGCEFGTQTVALEDGLECVGVDGVRHFVCDKCLAPYVKEFLNRELRLLRAAEGRISCPGCGSGMPYTDQQLAQHVPDDIFKLYLGLRTRIVEQQLAEMFEVQMKATLEAELRHLAELDEEQRKVQRARQYITENILNLKCPRCRQVYTDFNGCCALHCSRCPCAFCAWCLKDCGTDAHKHVAECKRRPAGVDGIFPGQGVMEQHQRKRRQKLVTDYLATLEPAVRRAVMNEMRRDLEDLQLQI